MTVVDSAADLMDRIYRPQQRIYDATRKYYLLGRDRMIAGLRPGPADRVLEIGCGTGRNLVLAARLYPGAVLFGIDVSREMLATADRALLRSGLADRVRTAHADATTFAPQALFNQASFERIFISYSLSMIPAWEAVLERSIGLLAPGGELHLVDFGDQGGLPGWFRAGLRRWLRRFHVTPCDRLEATIGRLGAGRNAAVSLARPYRGYAQIGVVRLPLACSEKALSESAGPHRDAAL